MKRRFLPGLAAVCALLAISFLALPSAELKPENASRITRRVGEMLQEYHYRKTPLDDQLSGLFLTNFLQVLDYSHLYFMQPDVDEFVEKYATSLDDAVKSGETAPGFEIFARFKKRLGEKQELVKRLLKEEFDFSQDDTVQVRRDKEPWPKTAAEAEQLWRARIKHDLLVERLNNVKPEKAVEKVGKRYERVARMWQDYETEEIVQLYLTSLAHAYDPHSEYMGPTEANNFSINNITLKLSGIGAVLRWDDGFTLVERIMPGGPADLSKKLRLNDRIVAVAQGSEEPVDVVEMPLKKVVELIRGKPGTEVRLTIIPHGAEEKKVITIVRDEVKITEQQASARIVEYPENGKTIRLGVVLLPQFYQDCAAHVEKLLIRLKEEKVDGVVLDLRRNGGGILDQAVQMTGLFLKRGPVVQVRDTVGKNTILKDEDNRVAYDGPLVVLVSKYSASASEIVAAALQDYGRALIVGDQSTHGKGTVQTLIPPDRIMKDSGDLKFTISKFYRVAGGTTQKHGVAPDIILPSVNDYRELGEASLTNPLPPDEITPLEYVKVDRVKPFLAELTSRSKDRIQSNTDFQYVLEDIEWERTSRERKAISLNEAVRKKEIEDRKQTLAARKTERDKRAPRSEKVHELTLEAAVKNLPLKPYEPKKRESGSEMLEELEGERSAIAELLMSESHVDPHLDETLHILAHYSRLLNGFTGKGVNEKVASTP